MGLNESVYFSDETTPEIASEAIFKEAGYEDLDIEINMTGVIPSLFVEEQNKRRVMNECANMFGMVLLLYLKRLRG